MVESSSNEQEKNERVTPLRTFEGDVAEILGKGKTTTAEILAAESKRSPEEAILTTLKPEEKVPSDKKKLFTIISGVIVLAGIIGFIAYWFIKPPARPAPPLTSTGQPFISIDLEKTIDLTNLTYKQTLDAIIRERDAAALRVNSTESLAFINRDLSGNATQLKASEFLTRISPSLPQSLARSIEDQFAFGLIGFDGNHPFLILRTNAFDSTYGGMLRSEVDFYREVGPLFVTKLPLPGLSSSTLAYYGTDPSVQVFHDVVASNIDTRAVKNERGEIIFLYAFPDQATLVVTTNQKTFGEIISKLKRSRLIR